MSSRGFEFDGVVTTELKTLEFENIVEFCSSLNVTMDTLTSASCFR